MQNASTCWIPKGPNSGPFPCSVPQGLCTLLQHPKRVREAISAQLTPRLMAARQTFHTCSCPRLRSAATSPASLTLSQPIASPSLVVQGRRDIPCHLSLVSTFAERKLLCNLQTYPTPRPHRCPTRLVFGTSTEITTASMSGVVHVGILYVAMVRLGLVLYVFIASTPRRRNTHMLVPSALLVKGGKEGAYLAPMTALSPRNIILSMTT
jgi:hypothetical protein